MFGKLGKRFLCSICVCLFLVGHSRAELVGWWTFDDDVLDHSGFDNHGELFGGSYDSLVPPAIGSGKSLNLEDNTDHVFVEADASLDSDEFTISMFIYDRGQVGAMERLTSRQGDTFETALNVHGPFNGMGEYSYYSPSAGWQWGEDIPPIEQWQHVAYVADGASMTIYADGEVVVDEAPFTSAPAGFLHIGNRWNDVEGFDGLIDDVAIWDEVLAPDVIAGLANGTRRPLTVAGEPGDFDGNGQLDAADIDALSAAVRANNHPVQFDLNGDTLVNNADRVFWVEELKRTYFGDTNLDGEFNSADFVIVFQGQQYEDTVARNSTWATGDWNGDEEFNSSDFVTAFQGQGFEIGPRPAAAVPEPSGILLLAIALACVMKCKRGE